jgi:hypothetical protein
MKPFTDFLPGEIPGCVPLSLVSGWIKYTDYAGEVWQRFSEQGNGFTLYNFYRFVDGSPYLLGELEMDDVADIEVIHMKFLSFERGK